MLFGFKYLLAGLSTGLTTHRNAPYSKALTTTCGVQNDLGCDLRIQDSNSFGRRPPTISNEIPNRFELQWTIQLQIMFMAETLGKCLSSANLEKMAADGAHL